MRVYNEVGAFRYYQMPADNTCPYSLAFYQCQWPYLLTRKALADAGADVSNIDPRVLSAINANAPSTRFDTMEYKVRVRTYDPVNGFQGAPGPGDPLNNCTGFYNSPSYLLERAYPSGAGAYMEFTAASPNPVPQPASPRALTCEQASGYYTSRVTPTVTLSL